MKTLVKLSSFIMLLAFIGTSFSGMSQDAKEVDSKDINVYYFHATKRCATCQAVEEVAQKTLKEYTDQVNFETLNREKSENKALVNKYEIAGQTLLVVKGEEVIDLTTYAFMYARTSPKKLEKRIKKTLDELL